MAPEAGVKLVATRGEANKRQAEVLGAIKRQQQEAAAGNSSGQNKEATCSCQCCLYYPSTATTTSATITTAITGNKLSLNKTPPSKRSIATAVAPENEPTRHNNNNKTQKFLSSMENLNSKGSRVSSISHHRTNNYQCINKELLPTKSAKGRAARPLPVPMNNPKNHQDCAKCQLIARWTSAQAQLAKQAAAEAKQQHQHQHQQVMMMGQLCGQQYLKCLCDSSSSSTNEKSRSCLAPGGCHSSRLALRLDTGDRCVAQSNRKAEVEEEEEEAEISSLTETNSSACREEEEEEEEINHHEHRKFEAHKLAKNRLRLQDKWPISCASSASASSSSNSSSYEELQPEVGVVAESPLAVSQAATGASDHHQHQQLQVLRTTASGFRGNSLRRRRLHHHQGASKLMALGLRKRRPAPLPPSARPTRRPPNPLLVHSSAASDKSVDSGHSSSSTTIITATSGGDSTTGSGSEEIQGSGRLTAAAAAAARATPNLLTEAEVYSIEHFLRSHKSSIYVCGCMANLYLTNTNLVDNGRCSKPSSEGWQLSKTGVPVLTFDSGLTRNRNKRRLSINLTERGSGFVLWSDIIDHLSNYRAYSAQIHGTNNTTRQQDSSSGRKSTIGSGSSRSGSSCENPKENNKIDLDQVKEESSNQTCDTFHVMYLSTNHRIMVGLSFDDAKCARLFLKQVEMVSSDPENIALTGPKLAHRLVSNGSKLARLLAGSRRQQAGNKQPPDQLEPLATGTHLRGPKSVGEQQQQQQQQIKATSAAGRLRFGRLMVSRRHSVDAGPQISGGSSSEYTWSTLKRAIRQSVSHHQSGGTRCSRGSNRVPLDERVQQTDRALLGGDDPEDYSQQAYVSPKPLASLAMAGKLYRAGKKLPRKCDISAPCLFQHVTRVDLANLDKLYTRSLVGAQAPGPASGSGSDSSGKQAPVRTDDIRAQEHSQAQKSQQQQVNSKLTMISQTTTSGSISASSSTSCYSSASISPASSEYETQQQQQSRVLQRDGRRHLPRPLPPRVPRRSEGEAEEEGEEEEVRGGPLVNSEQVNQQQQQRNLKQRHSQQQVNLSQPKVKASAGGKGGGGEGCNKNGESKIQAIIRDLEAQTSAELVEAKRKLMADIADQVMARASVSHL